MEKGEKEEVLEQTVMGIYIDDSNHAGDKKIGEVDAAVFSLNPEDMIVKKHPKSRSNPTLINNFFKSSNRNYIFAILSRENFRHTQTNLPYVAHYFLQTYLQTKIGYVSKIKFFLDGKVASWQKERLLENFTKIKDCPPIEITNYQKKKNVHRCPIGLYVADLLARRLFRSSLEKLNKHEKLIDIPFNEEMFFRYSYK